MTNSIHALSDDDLRRILKLTARADSVELKLTIPETQHNTTTTALGLDPLEAHLRQVFFFDTPDLSLDAAGVVVRARRIQDDLGDSVVKLRPVEPDTIAKDLRRDPAFTIEVDAMPGGYVCSGSYKGTADNRKIHDAVLGKRRLRSLFSKGQRAFYRTFAADAPDFDDLVALGPVNVVKLKYTPEQFPRKLAVEMWFYPDGSRILELSTKCAPNQAFQVAAEARAFLSARGIELTSGQHAKTRTALDYFSRARAVSPAES
jgi:hypothetical protein